MNFLEKLITLIIPIIDPKIFFGTIAGCILIGVLIKLLEILTYDKGNPNPLPMFPIEVTLAYKYVLLAGITCVSILFIIHATLPITKSLIGALRSLF